MCVNRYSQFQPRYFEKKIKIPFQLLLIVGDGPERTNKSKKKCKESKPVITSGPPGKAGKQWKKFYRSRFIFFAHHPETESFGLAALEAMACQVSGYFQVTDRYSFHTFNSGTPPGVYLKITRNLAGHASQCGPSPSFSVSDGEQK